jgi:hypothetical protein
MKKKNARFSSIIMLLFGFCFINTGKAELLIFEYEYQTNIHGAYGGEFCYYVLVLDTARMKGTFCAGYCYFGHPGLEFLKTEITYKYGYEKESLLYYPTSYSYETNDLIRQQYKDSTWMKKQDFYFRYDIKNNWNRLEHPSLAFLETPKKKKQKTSLPIIFSDTDVAGLSPFLVENEIHWFPPYLNRVKQLDMSKIPEHYRSDFEDCLESPKEKIIVKSIQNKNTFFQHLLSFNDFFNQRITYIFPCFRRRSYLGYHNDESGRSRNAAYTSLLQTTLV